MGYNTFLLEYLLLYIPEWKYPIGVMCINFNLVAITQKNNFTFVLMKNKTTFSTIALFLLIFFGNNMLAFGEELSAYNFYNKLQNPKKVKSEKKAKKDKNKSEEKEGASAKNNFVIQPTINFGHHSGFSKIKNGFGYDYYYTGLIPGFTLNLDYNPHKYASIGAYYGVSFQKFTKSNVLFLSHAFGVRSAFHWWQLLADKSHKNLLADKIDFDIHAHLGGFMATEKDNTTNVKLKHLGFAAGGGIAFRYYFVKYFGVALEAGYEENSWMKVGMVLKL